MAEEMLHIIIILLLTIIIIFCIIIVFQVLKNRRIHYQAENTLEKQELKSIEKIISSYVKPAIKPNDIILTQANIKFNEKSFNSDAIIINQYGVFIIEIKTWVGKIVGANDNNNWGLVRSAKQGRIYTEDLQNPLNQIEREEHILGNLLRENGINIDVIEYAYFIWENAPFAHDNFVFNQRELDEKIHRGTNIKLSAPEVYIIKEIIENA